MVEGRQFAPTASVVTAFAVLDDPNIGVRVMWIRVASLAAEAAESILHRREMLARRRFVTIRARCCGMAAGKLEARFRVAGKGERRRPETVNCVAGFTLVLVHGVGELTSVRIAMTTDTSIVFHLVLGVAPGRNVAFFAGRRRMLAEQRIRRLLMAADCEKRGPEALLVVTACTVLRSELAFVRIVPVAVAAACVSN